MSDIVITVLLWNPPGHLARVVYERYRWPLTSDKRWQFDAPQITHISTQSPGPMFLVTISVLVVVEVFRYTPIDRFADIFIGRVHSVTIFVDEVPSFVAQSRKLGVQRRILFRWVSNRGSRKCNH